MLRIKQKQRLTEMLCPPNTSFKVLVIDKGTQDILSPLLKVSDLRDCGVTTHLLIENQRSAIPTAPAIYFISDSKSLYFDLQRDLYAKYFLNFSTFVTRKDLEIIAVEMSKKQEAYKIASVKDLFIDFISLQDDLFTLNINNSYLTRTSDSQTRKIIYSLLSVFITLNECPLIFCDKKFGAINSKIKSLKIIKKSVKRPVLIILDRDYDLLEPMKHSLNYIEILHDLFNINLNKVEDVDLNTDSEFYKENIFESFPLVAERVEKDLHEYKKEMALRCIDEKSDKKAISEALEKAPELKRKNDIVNTNLNLCMKIVEETKKRNIDDFVYFEENTDKNDLLELSDKGNDNDILRLAVSMLKTKHTDLIAPLLAKRNIPSNFINFFKENLKNDDSFGSKFKKYIFKEKSTLVSYVENILNKIKTQNYEDISYYDPLNSDLFIKEVSSVIIFINGGCTYSELRELKEIQNNYDIPICLGGTEILNADNFIDQIKQIIN